MKDMFIRRLLLETNKIITVDIDFEETYFWDICVNNPSMNCEYDSWHNSYIYHSSNAWMTKKSCKLASIYDISTGIYELFTARDK